MTPIPGVGTKYTIKALEIATIVINLECSGLNISVHTEITTCKLGRRQRSSINVVSRNKSETPLLVE